MREYVLWATNPHDGRGSRPISEKVFDIKENERRKAIAISNGWENVYTQTIDYNNTNIRESFIKAINNK